MINIITEEQMEEFLMSLNFNIKDEDEIIDSTMVCDYASKLEFKAEMMDDGNIIFTNEYDVNYKIVE